MDNKEEKSKNPIYWIYFYFLIVLDLLLKGQISRFSVLSHDPIIGARYYGIGNEMVGLFVGLLDHFCYGDIEKEIQAYFPNIIYSICNTSCPS